MKPRNLVRRDRGQREREVAEGGKWNNETRDGKTKLMKGRTGTRAKGAEVDKETIEPIRAVPAQWKCVNGNK